VFGAFLLLVFTVVITMRGAWLAGYVVRFLRNGHGLSRRRSLVWAARAPTSSVFRGSANETNRQVSHQRTLDTSVHQVEILLLIGSVAFAGWTQLFAASGQFPGNQITGLSRALLLTASIVLIVGPGIFRSSGGHLTYMGRESMSAIGYSALVLALASVLADLGGSAGATIGAVMALAIVCREVLESRAAITANRYVNTEPPPAANV
jgi:hypothetical protein